VAEIVKLDQKIGLLAAAVTVAAAGNAGAQSSPSSAPPTTSAETPGGAGGQEPAPRWTPLSRFGMTLAGGGGVTAFTGSGTRDVAQTGGSWAVRLTFRTRRLLGPEISYIGGANRLHSLGLDTSDTRLIRNGIELALRLNAPLYLRDTLLEPYFTGGVGWNGYRITNASSATASASPTSANTVALPLAVGFAVGYKGFLADLRTTIRPTYRQTTLPDQGSGALTNWDFGGMIGFEF
jgi:hypothetical protein